MTTDDKLQLATNRVAQALEATGFKVAETLSAHTETLLECRDPQGGTVYIFVAVPIEAPLVDTLDHRDRAATQPPTAP